MWEFKMGNINVPRYLFIANNLEADILSGELPPGQKLMPMRHLAEKLGVTVATVTKAYNEVEKRGMVKRHVGRGTYVLGSLRSTSKSSSKAREPQESDIIDLGTIQPLRGQDPSVKPILQRICRDSDVDDLVSGAPPLGEWWHREIGADWLRTAGIKATAESVIIANGQQHALSTIISALLRPGDRMAVGQFNTTAIPMLLHRHGMEMEPVPMDEQGLMPDRLDALCSAKKIKALYVPEYVLNPSGRGPSSERQEEVREVISKHGLLVFQDGSYHWANPDKKVPFAALMPKNTIYYIDIGPAVYCGLRVAFIHAPEQFYNHIAQMILENTWTVPPLTVTIACEVITDKSIHSSIKNKLLELKRRTAVVKEALAEYSVNYSEDGVYAWLYLPDSWPAREFERHAEKNGVKTFAADRFVLGQTDIPNCVRISLTAPKDIETLKKGLDILVKLLKENGSLITPIW